MPPLFVSAGEQRRTNIRCMKGRSRNISLGPPALCDACLRSCITLDQAGAICYHCGEGVFMHRMFWQVLICPQCRDNDATWCTQCRGSGMLSVPARDDDLSLVDLAAAWEYAIARAVANGRQESPAIEQLREALRELQLLL